jgi:peptidoglycan/LPS O-acetylase OafA/YrhL
MKKLNYLGHIDSLRGIAIIFVFFFHLDVPFFKGGFIGVDLFFVISGFLITRIIVNELENTNKFNFKKFYIRRIKRLIPVLFLTFLIAFIFGFFLFSPSHFMKLVDSILMSSVSLSNIYFYKNISYFEDYSKLVPLLHTWSLSTEEQFYLFYPLFLILVKKFLSKKNLFKAILFLLTLSFLLTFIYRENSLFHFYMLPFRVYEFMIGGLIVFLKVNYNPKKHFSFFLNILAFALLIAFVIFININNYYLSTLNIMPCLAIGYIVFNPSEKLNFIFKNKALIYIGKISYSLYLIHWIVIAFFRYIINSLEFAFHQKIIIIIVSVFVSIIIYEYFENPIRKMNKKHNKKLFLAIVIALIVIISLKIHINNNEGWLFRLTSEKKEIIKEISYNKAFIFNNWGGESFKKIKTDKNSNPKMIWIGDSFAMHYFYGLDSIYSKKNNVEIKLVDGLSSLKLPEIYERKYKEKSIASYQKSLETVVKHPNAVVVLSQFWKSQIKESSYLDEEKGNFEPIPEGIEGHKVILNKILKLHEIIGLNRKLIIVGQSPTNMNPVKNTENQLRPKYFDFKPKTKIENYNTAFNNFLKNGIINRKNIYFFNPSDVFCIDKNCDWSIEKAYFVDNGHLSKKGSLEVIKVFEKKFDSVLN